MKNPEEILADAIEKGASKSIRKLTKEMFIYLAIIMFLVFWYESLQPYDTTDKHGERSGITIRVDNMTGCEYLANQGGGLTPRLNKYKEHIGCSK